MTDTPTDAADLEQPAEQPADAELEAPNPLLDELKQERRTRRQLESRLAELEQHAEQQRLESLSDVERQLETARTEARDQVMAEVRRDLAAAKVQAAAAAMGYVDPADAVAQLNLEQLDLDDASAVQAAVAELAERKPYLIGKLPPTAPAVPAGPVADNTDSGTFQDFLRAAVRGG